MNKRIVVPEDYIFSSPCPGQFVGYVTINDVVVDGDTKSFVVEQVGAQFEALVPEQYYEEAVKAFASIA